MTFVFPSVGVLERLLEGIGSGRGSAVVALCGSQREPVRLMGTKRHGGLRRKSLASYFFIPGTKSYMVKNERKTC